MTIEDIDHRIDQAEADMAAGRVISNEEMMAMIDSFVEEAKKSV